MPEGQEEPWPWDDIIPEMIYVDDETWEELMEELERPPKVIPSLVELFKRGQDNG